jgi:transketolase N-terminal domain/subunit
MNDPYTVTVAGIPLAMGAVGAGCALAVGMMRGARWARRMWNGWRHRARKLVQVVG